MQEILIENEISREYREIIEQSKARFMKNAYPSLKERIDVLNRLLESIDAHERDIFASLRKDLGKHEFEAYTTEVSLVKAEISVLKKKLGKWMKPKTVKTPIISIGGKSKIIKQPKGVVLIFSPWNYPFQLTMVPLISAIGAGNNVIIKTSPYSLNTTRIMKQIISECFEPDQVYLVETNLHNDVDIATDLLNHSFDHIFFTGSTKVGKMVYQAAAKHLTPVTLELGGKNPVIVDESANLKLTAMRMVWGKAINSGQSCIAPDYLLVKSNVKEELVKEIGKAIERFYNDDMLGSDSYSSIINQTHFDRLVSYLKGQDILIGGKTDPEKLKFELTVINNPDLESEIMQNEIFGPLLPIFTYEKLEEAYNIISKYKNPLAVYVFSKRSKVINDITKNVSFGGGAINDVLMHFVSTKLPFGGVGNSGIGNYHGKYGFDTFTHEKSILKQTLLFDLPIRYAPFKKFFMKLAKLILK